eukprot:jgi/Mesen1/5148/ME000255S04128
MCQVGINHAAKANLPAKHDGASLVPYSSAPSLDSGRLQSVTGPSTWLGRQVVNETTWVHSFTDSDIREIDAALASIEERNLSIVSVTKEDFRLPTLSHLLARVEEHVLHGRGFFLLRGLPVGRYSRWQQVAAFWGIGAHLGWAVSQNGKGHMVGHIRDLGNDSSHPTTRIYTTRAAQPYHTDSCDVVALLCLQPASFSSSASIYNAMLQDRPDLVRVLLEPFHVDRKGEVPPGKLPHYQMPVFHWHDDGRHLSVVYARDFIQAAQRFLDVPRLTPLQLEALDLFDELAARPDIRLDMELAPGDVQILHNHQEEDRRRHLLRLWLSPPRGRPLPPVFAERYGTVEASRGSA